MKIHSQGHFKYIQRAWMMAVLFFCFSMVRAQSDSLAFEEDTLPEVKLSEVMRKRWNMEPHSPLKATVFSAIIPGAGQIYNKKYWKAPIAWAGEGVCIGFILFNNKQYQYYKTEYIKLRNNQPSLLGNNVDPASVSDVMDTYHQWRDLSYICLAAVHLLQVIDANVDAHLTYYDIGDDLSLYFHPSFVNTGRVSPGLGITLQF